MKKARYALVTAFIVIAAGLFSGYHVPSSRGASPLSLQSLAVYDVPYVPTDRGTIEEMLWLCKVTPADIVYDLGCGDGRIAIMAAKKFGARAVGIDIDPERIRESRENAAKAGVSDKARFIQQDLFEADFSEATVVTLYLLSTINLKLRPLLLDRLKPGTRVVSHDFGMEDWEADEIRQVGSDTIYYWVIPAKVGGVWIWNDSTTGERQMLRIAQQFQKVKGSLTKGRASVPIHDALLTGDLLSFKVRQSPGDLRFEAKVKGNTLEGTITPIGKPARPPSTWTAKREAAENTSFHVSRR